MVSADTGETYDLLEVGQVAGELSGGECFRIVGEVLLWDNSSVTAHPFECFLCLQCFMGVETDLMLDKDEAGGVVDKDAPTGVHFIKFRFSCRGK